MSTTESKLINAVCENKDISILLETDADHLFVSHSDIWNWLRDYYFRYKAVPDAQSVKEEFSDFEAESTNSATRHYLDKLRDEYISTQVKDAIVREGKRLGDDAGVNILERLQKELSVISRQSNLVRDIDLTDYESAEEFYRQRHERAEAMGGAPGIPTGIKAIDTHYPTGMAPNHLIVIIGWSGKGKTWFASYLACKAWSAGFKPMIVSLEMSPEEMRDRIYTIMGSGMFRNSNFSRGSIDIDAFDRWARQKLEGGPKFVVVSNEGTKEVTPSTVQAKIDQHRPDIVICDYHQLFDDDHKGANETVRNRNISRDFKLLAVRNAIPVVDLSQVTQKENSDTSLPPLLEDVAWSKGIQHDADLAMAVHKTEDSNLFTILSRKTRHGPDFEFALDWDVDRGVVREIYGDIDSEG